MPRGKRTGEKGETTMMNKNETKKAGQKFYLLTCPN